VSDDKPDCDSGWSGQGRIGWCVVVFPFGVEWLCIDWFACASAGLDFAVVSMVNRSVSKVDRTLCLWDLFPSGGLFYDVLLVGLVTIPGTTVGLAVVARGAAAMCDGNLCEYRRPSCVGAQRGTWLSIVN